MKRDKLQSFKSQLYGFVVKTFVQRWRSPFSTAAEVLLPFIFVLLLCIGYWTSSTTVTKSQVFDPSNEKLKLSAWSSVNYFFCAGPEGKLKLRLRPCIHSKDGDYTCMSNVADGKSLCLFNKFDLAVKGQSMAYTGLKARPIALGSLDTYLVLSAFVTNWAVGMEKTFFERSYLGSLSHYGKLLVASENDEVARLFMTYCRARSSMCTDVLHPDVFDSNESAMTYAVDNANTVWAILYLPHDLFTGGTRKEMSISMNYSATPKTFKAKAESFFTHKISEARSTDADFMLYYASGFAPLQNFVHSFYLAHLVKTTKLIGPGQYLSDATSKGISSFLGPSSGRTMPMPTPASTSNMFMDKWVYYMPMVAVISAIFPIARFTGLIVDEKAKGIREAMMIMGMRHSCLFAGWYVSAIAIDAVAALFVSTVLCLGCLHTTNWLIVFGVYFTFLQQNSAMCMLISAFFSNARLASWFAAFMSFLLIMPFYSIPTATQDISRLMMSLLPDVGYAQAFDIMAKYARTQTSVSFAVAAQGTLCINHIVGVMWLSTVVMMILAMYLDQVLPNATGVAKHPLFFLKPLLCGLCLSHASSLSADSHESCSSNPRNKHAQPLTLAANIRNGDDRRKSGSSHDRLPDCVSKLQERDATHFMENESAIIDPAHPDSAVVLSHVCKVYSLTTFANFVYTLFTGLLRPGSRVVALNGITLSMRRNEICVLLGPNGSGKTTMMNIIAGMTEPTSGKVYIHGMHRTRDPDNCQRCIGYCPQRNTVWNTLTVEEHLTFYARLKGSASVHISQVVANTMGQVNLTHKRHSYAGSLSGGELRRLCLGMALVGDSSVLLLDEPTAGMDMKGRQVMYEVLRRTRQGRSVLLCTHQLDGADRVADRVIMIQHGSLRAVGSPMYLKSRMPTGYVVTCILNPSLVSPAEQQRATNELLDYIRAKAHSNQLVMTDVVQEVPLQCHLFAMQRRGREVVLRLPFSTGTDLNNTFFRSLVADKAMLKLHSIGLQVTSLESVYTTVMADEENANSLLLSSMSAAGDGSRADPSAAVGANGVIAVGKEDPRSTGESALMENEHGGENNSNENSMCTKNSQNISAAEGQLIHGAEHDTHIVYTKHNFAVTFVRHMRALFLKRWHFAKRDCKTITFQIVFPVFFLLLALLINLTRAPTQPSLLMDMSMYMDYQTNPSEVVVATSPPYEAAFALNATSPASILGDHYTYSWIHGAAIPADLSTPVSAQLLKEINTHASPRYVGLVPSVNVTNMSLTYTVLHNTSFPHTLPQGIDVMYHTAQSQLFGTAVPKLVTRNTPMRMSAYEVQLYGTSKPVIQGMFIIVPFVLLPAHMISYIVHEHECGARHLQWMSGVSVLAYWLSSFLFDAVCYVFTVALTFAMFFLFGMREYTSNDTFAASVVMFLLFGLASIPFNYVLSFFFRSPSAAQNFVLFINFSGGFLWPTMQSFLITGLPNFVPLMAKILRCLPATSFGESIFIISGNSMAKMLVMMGYHMNIWAWVNSGGVFTSLTYMLCTLAVSVFLLIVFEYVKLNKLLRLFSSQILSEHKPNGTDNVGANSPNPITSKRPCTDTSNYIYAENGSVALRNEVPPDYIHVNSSVALEEQRVCDCSCGYPREDGIVMQHITKQYFGTNAAALRDFSLGVHKGEVMALLGLNGAGKSTAMGILAGKIVANTGKAFMNHKNVLNVAARVETGYCPQTNPLLHMLTAQEHLWLYARLRGAVECTIAHEVNSLLRELGLFAHRHTPACRLSGGNQRRLCLAVSLVGNTSVVLLDEPTAGMDVLARLQTCKMIQRLAAKKSVLLTTHLMDEVEALANRVAFLVNGRLSSVGTPHDLKMSYMGGMSHMVTILFPCSEVDLQDAEQQGVVRAVKAHMDDLIQQSNCTNRNEEDEMRKEGSKQCGMSECVVQDVRFSSMTLMTNMPLSSILTFVSDLYAGRVPNVPCVSNVSISQPTLEDVLSRQ